MKENILPIGTVYHFRDITSFIEYENIRKNFMSTVSHELRTPISAIILSINNLKKFWTKLTPTKINDLISKIQSNSNLLSLMIEELLL